LYADGAEGWLDQHGHQAGSEPDRPEPFGCGRQFNFGTRTHGPPRLYDRGAARRPELYDWRPAAEREPDQPGAASVAGRRAGPRARSRPAEEGRRLGFRQKLKHPRVRLRRRLRSASASSAAPTSTTTGATRSRSAPMMPLRPTGSPTWSIRGRAMSATATSRS